MWQPSATIETLKARAEFIASIRQFFQKKQVMEVETPILSSGTVTDLHLDAFQARFEHGASGKDQTLYLQTSPEFAMKRLLAAGSGAIFQICKSFRHEAAGRFHNPEFTMLEWYRPDFNEQELMTEIDELLQHVLHTKPAQTMSYQRAFLQALSIDPLTIELAQLKEVISTYSDDNWLQQETSKDTLLQWLFSMKVEPKLGWFNQRWTPCFVYDFPASQASLAKLNTSDKRIAHRFELYFQGVELANGFYELQDHHEQLTRFNMDNQLREHAGLSKKPIDKHLLAALEFGLPDCSGVAIGIDRLFMLKQSLKHIKHSLTFDVERA